MNEVRFIKEPKVPFPQADSFTRIICICEHLIDKDMSANEICGVWKKVVSGVRSYKHESEDSEKRIPIGERLAGNTRVIDLRNGVLLVETDHPGWIQYLRMYQKYILTGLKMNLPDLKLHQLFATYQSSDTFLNVHQIILYLLF